MSRMLCTLTSMSSWKSLKRELIFSLCIENMGPLAGNGQVVGRCCQNAMGLFKSIPEIRNSIHFFPVPCAATVVSSRGFMQAFIAWQAGTFPLPGNGWLVYSPSNRAEHSQTYWANVSEKKSKATPAPSIFKLPYILFHIYKIYGIYDYCNILYFEYMECHHRRNG